MLPKLKEYYRPQKLSEALALLQRTDVHTVPLAGGTDLVSQKDALVEAVVDLQELGLDYIKEGDSFVRLGAVTTLQTMATSPILRALADGVVAEAAHNCAARIVRNMATLGGTLISRAGTTDLPPTLLALEAEVLLLAPDERRLSLAEFYVEENQLPGSGWLLTEVIIPIPGGSTGASLQRVSRTPSDRAIINVAAVVAIKDGVCQKARAVAGGMGPVPVSLSTVAAFLEGKELSAERIDEAAKAVGEQLDPPSDFLASGEYRREMGIVLVRRALKEARLRAQKPAPSSRGGDYEQSTSIR